MLEDLELDNWVKLLIILWADHHIWLGIPFYFLSKVCNYWFCQTSHFKYSFQTEDLSIAKKISWYKWKVEKTDEKRKAYWYDAVRGITARRGQFQKLEIV